MNKLILFCVSILLSVSIFAQSLTQTIQGKIVDESSQEPLPYANILIKNSNPIIGTTADFEGNFILNNVAIGRYDIEVSFIGYEPIIIPEVLVSSAKVVYLNILLKEQSTTLNEIIIKPKVIKDAPINSMASVSARMLSVEEANRYAGGFDDPARLASSFPGVASGVSNNAITIRGNAPKFLQWKIEGVEIPNPNHFADLESFGGGGLTAFSSSLLANSDFFTGAFPAEYNNALSGVFDMRMRNGNSSKYEHSFELGLIGLGFASEGPLINNSNASYLFNYRYSTLGLISPLLPEDAGGTNYQDLSFKINFPTKKAGTFTLWGIGLIDNSGLKPEKDTTQRNYYQDIESGDTKQFMGAAGLNHKKLLKNSAYINTTLAFTSSGIDVNTDRLDGNLQLQPKHIIKNTNYNIVLKSYIHKKFNSKHSNKTGITIKGMGYDLLLKEAGTTGSSLSTLVSEDGFTSLLSVYTNSSFSLNNFTLNTGLNAQLFTLNNHYTIEPRFGISYRLNENKQISFGYGLHSRLEVMNIYFANTIYSSLPQANKDLDFSKAHHLILAYDWDLTEKLHLKIEPYFQYLFDIPIVKNSTVSLINLQNDWFINDAYTNAGEGINYGVDFTLEHYINKGFYFLFSASIFNSEYKTDQDEWYNTRYNKNYLANALVGKEYRVGKRKQNLLGFNIKLSMQGGDRYSVIDQTASALNQDVVYNETTPFTQQNKASLITHFTMNYEWYKKESTHKISLQILNANNFKEYRGHRYNIRTQKVEEFREALMLPNISYKISF